MKVTKIKFRKKRDNEDCDNHNIAEGVYVYDNLKSKDQMKYIKCNKEVILSAGTFNSPKLLMLSGIGDSQILNKHKIDSVYHNHEVGLNLQDHPFIPVTR